MAFASGRTPSSPSTASHSLQQKVEELELELNTPLFRRLDEPGIFGHLNWAGFTGNYHTLSVLSTYQRTIKRADDPGLHLMWKSNLHTEWIKPLPSVLADDAVDVKHLGRRSRGLLYSYTKLIRSELDFQIATELKLLPAEFATNAAGWQKWNDLAEKLWEQKSYPWLHDAEHHQTGCDCDTVKIDPCQQRRKFANNAAGWQKWNALAEKLWEQKSYPWLPNAEHHQTGCDCDTVKKNPCKELAKKVAARRTMQESLLRDCHPRYRYGDLRLNRVNWIVRLNLRIRGTTYFSTRSPYDTIVTRHSNFITAYVVYVALILTAMQVGLQASTTPVWVTQVCRYFSYIIVLFTGGQIPLILAFFACWIFWQLLTFWWRNRKPGRHS